MKKTSKFLKLTVVTLSALGLACFSTACDQLLSKLPDGCFGDKPLELPNEGKVDEGHVCSFDTWRICVEPKCEVDGEETSTCSDPDCGLMRNRPVPALGHALAQQSEKSATCGEFGHNAHESCSRCDYTTKETTVPTGVHSYSEGVCTTCDRKQPTDGLIYTLNGEGTGYALTGVEQNKNVDWALVQEIVVADYYEGLPVTQISNQALMGCCETETVDIPWGVSEIDPDGFSECEALQKFVVAENNPYYQSNDGHLYDADGKTLVSYARGKTATSYFVPEGVTKIGYRAFASAKNLTSITLPSTLEEICYDAFYRCISLTDLLIPQGLRSVGDGAFTECPQLKYFSVHVENEYFKEIDGNLYTKDGETLVRYAPAKTETSFSVPEDVKIIGYAAFEGVTALQSVSLSEGLGSIGVKAFENCANLTGIKIPSTVTKILGSAFSQCTSLSSVTFAENSLLEFIGDYAFANTSIREIVIPAAVEKMEYQAFNSCTKLENVIFEQTAGWSWYPSGEYEGTAQRTEIPSTDLANTERAAELLLAENGWVWERK